MASGSPFDLWSRRLAAYSYLAPLVSGRRILEIGSGTGTGASRLLALGATSVVGADQTVAAIEQARGEHRAAGLTFVSGLDLRSLEAAGPYDIIVVPEAAPVMAEGSALGPSVLKRLLPPRGRLVLLAESGDRPGTAGGVGYFELAEGLEPLFARVRMFGVTPFAAFGLAEFAEAPTAGLRVDGSLVDPESDQPTHYLVLGGPDEPLDLGYALVQVALPAEMIAAEPAPLAREESSGLAVPNAEAETAARELRELRRRLADAEGKAEGVLRVSRAQAEEIEELRGRLRRDAEARAELDRETARLRRGLAEADESVLNLTRKTTEEMAALAQRLTAGLRAAEQAPGRQAAQGDQSAQVTRLRETLRHRESELASRESALSDRDERIAALEAERQDLIWRLQATEERARTADERIRELEAEADAARRSRAAPPPTAAVNAAAERASDDRAVRLEEQGRALEHYRRAAVAHLGEVTRLREELAEQSTLVAELEEAFNEARARSQKYEQELDRVRLHAAEIEQADRARRSRLAEVEGTLLRLERQTALHPASTDGIAREEAQRRVTELSARVAQLEDRLREVEHLRTEAERLRDEAERRWSDAVERMVGLEREKEEAARAGSGEGAAGHERPRLDSALKEVARLREALERSEEQLWESKGQLLLDRERMAVLENQLAALTPAPPGPPSGGTVTRAAHQAIFETVVHDLAELESGLRVEIARLDSLERSLEAWRADLAVTDAEGDLPLSRV
jgi:SAM-dependent methyltransferase